MCWARTALLVAPGQPQPLLVALEGGFDAPASLIIEGDRGKPDRDRISGLRRLPPQDCQHLLERLRANQYPIRKRAVISATAYSHAAHGTNVARSRLAHPPKRTLRPVGI